MPTACLYFTSMLVIVHKRYNKTVAVMLQLYNICSMMFLVIKTKCRELQSRHTVADTLPRIRLHKLN